MLKIDALLACDYDPVALSGFIRAVESLNPGRSGASLALAGMAEALQDYEIAFGFLPTAFRMPIRELQQLAKRPTRTTVEQLLARRDRRPEPLTLLSRGAVSAGVLRRAADGEDDLEVKVNGGWIRPLGEQDSWLLRLAVDSSSLKAVSREAVTICKAEWPSRDFLRPFRELKKLPTKRRLLNILERDKDENGLRPAESAIRFAVLRLGIFDNDIPADWIERLGDNPDLLRKVAETVCKHFAYKIDGHGRPRDILLERYADRLTGIYEELTGKLITYAKATDTSRERRAGAPYGRGLDFMLAGLRMIDRAYTTYQAAAHIERIRTARKAS